MSVIEHNFTNLIQKDLPLSPYSCWKIGGPADMFAEISNETELQALIRQLQASRIPWCLIGRGTNLLFDDRGFRGCVIRLGETFSTCTVSGNTLTAQAGCWTPFICLKAARAGLSGIEHAIGIPASIGGLICMNGGSMRKGIGQNISSVRVLDTDGTIRDIDRENCCFAYRSSRFQQSGEIILQATLVFENPRPYAEQRPELLGILRERNRKFPRKLATCGSVFKSSPKLYAAYGPPGKIIEDLGFKGRRAGNIEVSHRHANFIVNSGNGSSADVLSLVGEILDTVQRKTGISMEPEFLYLHPSKGIINPATFLHEQNIS